MLTDEESAQLRDLLGRKVRAGIAPRVAAGIHGHSSLLTPALTQEALSIYRARTCGVGELAARYGVSIKSLYRAFRRLDPDFEPNRK